MSLLKSWWGGGEKAVLGEVGKDEEKPKLEENVQDESSAPGAPSSVGYWVKGLGGTSFNKFVPTNFLSHSHFI